MIRFAVSGQTMGIIEGSSLYSSPEDYDADEQGALEACEALHTANRIKRFSGHSYVVTTTRAGAEVILDYCETVADTWASESELELRIDARALRMTAIRIRTALAEADP